MIHQDWTTVVLKRPRPDSQQQREVQAKYKPSVSGSGKPAWKVEQQVDSDTGKPINLVPVETAKDIVRGRVAAKLTQKQLAQRLINISEKDINEIESGKAIENKAVLAKIKRFLGLN